MSTRYAVAPVRIGQAVIVARVGDCGKPDLLEVARAVRALGAVPRLRERRQQHRRENRDDRDDDEELDEGERSETEEPAESLHFSVLCVARTIVPWPGRHGVRLLRLRDSHGFSA